MESTLNPKESGSQTIDEERKGGGGNTIHHPSDKRVSKSQVYHKEFDVYLDEPVKGLW